MELLFFILGMTVGIAGLCIGLTAKSDGTLRIDSSDPDGPYMFLEVRRSIEDIRKKPFVILRVNLKSYLNLTNAAASIEAGMTEYPYHLDGQLCTMFSAADILVMAKAATEHKLYHTTYYNHLAAWVRRCETVKDVEAIAYGSELPEDLAANMAAILAAAQADKA